MTTTKMELKTLIERTQSHFNHIGYHKAAKCVRVCESAGELRSYLIGQLGPEPGAAAYLSISKPQEVAK